MADEGDLQLESLLNKATSPARRDEDWEAIMAFTDQVNKELEGPQIAVRLLAHKVQSPQEREALYALTTLEASVKNCGQRFHQEIGKFRFLNEMIKVVSPKYLGNHTSETVKKRCIEIMYSWSLGLKHEPKIGEAYSMLKRQGIVKDDPVYVEKTFEPPPPPRSKNAVFEDEEKSKLLARLLKSKHPEDLQAANRLIKNMVKQDAERMDRQSKRMQELETVSNNVKLLQEMLAHYSSTTATEADTDIMKELFENLEKQRPSLFRLASDTDEKDNEGISEILAVNDSVVKTMTLYKKVVEGISEENGILSLGTPHNNTTSNNTELSALFGAGPTPAPQPQSLISPLAAAPPSMLDDDLGLLGLGGANTSSTSNELGDLFGAAPVSASTQNDVALQDVDLFSSSATAGGLLDSQPQQPMMVTLPPPPQTMQPFMQTQQTLGFQAPAATPLTMNAQSTVPAASAMFGSSPLQASILQATNAPSVFDTPANTRAAALPTNTNTTAGSVLDDLDILGKSLLEHNLPPDKTPLQPSAQPPVKVPMNQMATTTAPVAAGQPALKTLANLSNNPELIPTPTGSTTSSPIKRPGAVTTGAPPKPAPAEVMSLTDVFVPLDTIKPGAVQPVTLYEKNELKVVVHFGKDKPREDVLVMVLSTVSTNANPVKNFMFQAAVPKLMKVKLQPPSATDLPANNPILPPAAITQVMLIANPHKEKVRLKFKITYVLNGQTVTDVGECDSFPIQ